MTLLNGTFITIAIKMISNTLKYILMIIKFLIYNTRTSTLISGLKKRRF